MQTLLNILNDQYTITGWLYVTFATTTTTTVALLLVTLVYGSGAERKDATTIATCDLRRDTDTYYATLTRMGQAVCGWSTTRYLYGRVRDVGVGCFAALNTIRTGRVPLHPEGKFQGFQDPQDPKGKISELPKHEQAHCQGAQDPDQKISKLPRSKNADPDQKFQKNSGIDEFPPEGTYLTGCSMIIRTEI